MTCHEEDLRSSVREAYSKAASHPAERHPFPVGVWFAESLGYPPDLLQSFPRESVDAFTGVSNVSLIAPTLPGARVVDLGCGAGLDSLITAERVGPSGKVVGFDFSEQMLNRAECAKRRLELTNTLFVLAAAEGLPLADASIDMVLVNGIFNLNPFRDAIFAELARIVRPAGLVVGAELVVGEALAADQRSGNDNWFS